MPKVILIEKLGIVTDPEGTPAEVIIESIIESRGVGVAIAEIARRKGELNAGEHFRVHEHNHRTDINEKNSSCRILGRQDP